MSKLADFKMPPMPPFCNPGGHPQYNITVLLQVCQHWGNPGSNITAFITYMPGSRAP